MAKRKTAPPDAGELEALAAEGLEDLVKHAACRAGFNLEMLKDPRIETLFDRWWLETGLAAELVRLRDLPEEERTDAIEAGDLERAFSSRADHFAKEALVFVRDALGCRWPWVCLDLLEAFVCESVAQTFGSEVTRTFTVNVEPDAPVPAPKFSTKANESLEDAIERLRAAAVAATPAETPPSPRPRRMPKNGGEYLEEAGRWYYRIHVRGESTSRLAKEYTADQSARGKGIGDDNRSTVRNRIKVAERVLGMTTWEIVPPEK